MTPGHPPEHSGPSPTFSIFFDFLKKEEAGNLIAPWIKHTFIFSDGYVYFRNGPKIMPKGCQSDVKIIWNSSVKISEICQMLRLCFSDASFFSAAASSCPTSSIYLIYHYQHHPLPPASSSPTITIFSHQQHLLPLLLD